MQALVLSQRDDQELGNISMKEEFFEVDGKVISAGDLRISKAEDFAKAVESAAYAHLIECRRTASSDEIIVFDAEVEIGQKTVHDIRSFERLAVTFEVSDTKMPEVLALRRDFPLVPHLNLRLKEFPRSLCVTEQKYSEWKLRSTGTTFVEVIRQWLSLTAKGRLHAGDQPLEPLLLGSEGELIIPSDLFTKAIDSEFLSITFVDSGNGRGTFIAERPKSIDEVQNPFEYVATVFHSAPQPHGVILRTPATLCELHEFLERSGMDLLGELRNRLRAWKNQHEEKILESRLALITHLPKTRNENSMPETSEFRAFLTWDTIRKVGIEIGLWEESNGHIGGILNIDQNKKGDKIQVGMLNPILSFSRERAARFNGLSSRDNRKITAVGLGALGSQVFMNLIRAGFGEWTLIDDDFLLPHNLARHALDGFSIGYPKVQSLAIRANQTIEETPIADCIVADVLNTPESSETCEKLKKAFSNAEIILDASASVPVARHLVHDIDSSARRISIFFNPRGTDVVILAEDEKRETTLNFLEMQYYRHLINEPHLKSHLQRNSERIRYATSCRDVSSTISQDFVALQSAICSRAIHQVTSNKEALLSIWCTDGDQINVQRHSFPVKNPISCKKGEWTLCTDEGVMDKVYKTRVEKLPNETGGVLVGTYDMQRKIVYVVDCLLSPPDSEEWPTVYIRGSQGLKAQIEKIKKITDGQLNYVGEWHSHPPHCSVKPSQLDRKVFGWLSDWMKADGLPPLMLIVGDPSKYAFYLEQME